MPSLLQDRSSGLGSSFDSAYLVDGENRLEYSKAIFSSIFFSRRGIAPADTITF